LQLTSTFDQPDPSSKDGTSFESPAGKSLYLKEEELEAKVETKEEITVKVEPGIFFLLIRKTNLKRKFLYYFQKLKKLTIHLQKTL